MRRAVLDGPGRVRIADVDAPTPADGEALVRVLSAGVCGGDVALLHGRNAVANYPLTPGHECVGVVEHAPAGAAVAAGDHVIVFPTLSCGRCRACREGRENHCPQMRVLGLNDPRGCFADRIAVDAGQLIGIDAGLASRVGALLEPLAVGVHVNRRGAVANGDRVLVVGTGVIGILSALVARARGAAEVFFVDRLPERADLLAALGFSHFSTALGAALDEWIAEAAGEVDVVLDTVTVPETVATAVAALRRGGTYVPVASPKPEQQLCLPYDLLYAQELTVAGCRNYNRADFREAVALSFSGAVDPTPLVTDRVPLTALPDALEALTSAPAEHLKILVE